MRFTYQTPRLNVSEVFQGSGSTSEHAQFLSRVTELLTPKVVENLPPYFSDVNTLADAEEWFQTLVPESRLFMAQQADTQTIIGFVFVYVEQNSDAHIGYLLGEPYWGKGFGTELLQGLIEFAIQDHKWHKLIAGVDTSNKVSANLLRKLGFKQQLGEDQDMLFYEYWLKPDKV